MRTRAARIMGTVTLRVIEAHGLRRSDLIGSSDPYVVLLPGGQRTHYVANNLNPRWDVTLKLRVSDARTDAAVFEVYDNDHAGRDDFLGYAALEFGAVTTQPRMVWLELHPPGSGQLHVAVSADFTGPYAGLAARPSNAPPLVAPSNYHVVADNSIVRDQRSGFQNFQDLF